MPYFPCYIPSFLLNGCDNHPDRALWGLSHLQWRSEMMDKLGELAFKFRSASTDDERRQIADDYAKIWAGIKGGDLPPPEDQLPDEWMPK